MREGKGGVQVKEQREQKKGETKEHWQVWEAGRERGVEEVDFRVSFLFFFPERGR